MTNCDVINDLIAEIKIELPGNSEAWYQRFVKQCVRAELQILKNQTPCNTCKFCSGEECIRGDYCEYLQKMTNCSVPSSME